MSKRQCGTPPNFCLPVRLSRDSDCKNHSIRSKFGTNIHVLSEVSCVVFGVHSASRSYREVQKILQIHCTDKKIPKYSVSEKTTSYPFRNGTISFRNEMFSFTI